MGFSGGGSNTLLPHTHDGTVAQDGGPLDFDNVTQADLTAGDVVYSDGVHLQRLAIGTPAQQIQVNAGATAPEYFTPAGAASTWTELANVTLGGIGTLSTPTFAAHNVLDVYVFSANTSSNNMALAFNATGSGSSAYTFNNSLNFATSGAGSTSAQSINYSHAGNGTYKVWMNARIYNTSANEKLVIWNCCEANPAGNAAPYSTNGTGKWVDTAAQITSIQVVDSGGNSQNLIAGSQIIVLGAS